MQSADEYAQLAEQKAQMDVDDRVVEALHLGEALVYAVLSVASAIKNRPLP